MKYIHIQDYIDWNTLAQDLEIPVEQLVQSVRIKYTDESTASVNPETKLGFRFSARGSGDCSVHQREFYMGHASKVRAKLLEPGIQSGLLHVDQMAMPNEETLVLTSQEDVFIRNNLASLSLETNDLILALVDGFGGVFPGTWAKYEIIEHLPRDISVRYHPMYHKIPIVDGKPCVGAGYYPCYKEPDYWITGQMWIRGFQVFGVSAVTRFGVCAIADNNYLIISDDYKVAITRVHSGPTQQPCQDFLQKIWVSFAQQK